MKIKFLLVIMIAIGSIFFPFFGSSAEEKKIEKQVAKLENKKK